MAHKVQAYSISASDIAAQKERVDKDGGEFDIASVITLDTVEPRDVGPGDVHLRILAASAEHNVDHAALADTVNITELKDGLDFFFDQRAHAEKLVSFLQSVAPTRCIEHTFIDLFIDTINTTSQEALRTSN